MRSTAAFISGVRSTFGTSRRSGVMRMPALSASLACSSLICRSRAWISGHRGWARATRSMSTTTMRGVRATGGTSGARAGGGAWGRATGERPAQPARTTASAAQASVRVIAVGSLAPDFLDHQVGEVDPAVQDDLAAEDDAHALMLGDLVDGRTNVFLEATNQLGALLENLLVDLALQVISLGLRHRLHALLGVGDLRLSIILQGALRACFARVGVDGPGHVHIADGERLT